MSALQLFLVAAGVVVIVIVEVVVLSSLILLSVLSFENDLMGDSPVCVRAILGNYHLQLAEPAHGCSVCAGGELKEEALLFLAKRVQRLPKLPSHTNTSGISDSQPCILLFTRLLASKVRNLKTCKTLT